MEYFNPSKLNIGTLQYAFDVGAATYGFFLKIRIWCKHTADTDGTKTDCWKILF